MHTILRAGVGLAGVVFIALGAGWWLIPETVSPNLGLVLQGGVGRSTQIGDFGAFFLTVGLCMVSGAYTTRRHWFYPPMLLLALAATGRSVAWLFHDAPLAYDMIAVELLVVGLLLLTANTLRSAR